MDLQFEQDLKHYLRSLEEEYRIIAILNHRNRNQHRVAIWWKFFNILKRKTFDIIQRIHHILTSKITNVQKTLVRNVNQLYKSLHYFVKKQSKAVYYAFNGVIQLGQFVTLGVVLIGSFAKIQSNFEKLLQMLKKCKYLSINVIGKQGKLSNGANDRLVNTDDVHASNKEEIGEEVGEEVGKEEGQALKVSVSKVTFNKGQSLSVAETSKVTEPNTKVQPRKTKKTKRKSKNAIDDIFG